uniref:Family with sequence similarity 219 member B n=1 Tax=Eptatretus burgeri TaxID=7764 RepID=A0A8C4QPJ9_EPTBU
MCFCFGVFFLLHLSHPHLPPLSPSSSTHSLQRSSQSKADKPGLSVRFKTSTLQLIIQKQKDGVRRVESKNRSSVGRGPGGWHGILSHSRLVVPRKGYTPVDSAPDHFPIVAIDSDSEEEMNLSPYSSGYSSAELNPEVQRQLLSDGFRLDEVPDDEDLDLIPPRPPGRSLLCCPTCFIQ